jgi:hypothetical protein
MPNSQSRRSPREEPSTKSSIVTLLKLQSQCKMPSSAANSNTIEATGNQTDRFSMLNQDKYYVPRRISLMHDTNSFFDLNIINGLACGVMTSRKWTLRDFMCLCHFSSLYLSVQSSSSSTWTIQYPCSLGTPSIWWRYCIIVISLSRSRVADCRTQ